MARLGVIGKLLSRLMLERCQDSKIDVGQCGLESATHFGKVPEDHPFPLPTSAVGLHKPTVGQSIWINLLSEAGFTVYFCFYVLCNLSIILLYCLKAGKEHKD